MQFLATSCMEQWRRVLPLSVLLGLMGCGGGESEEVKPVVVTAKCAGRTLDADSLCVGVGQREAILYKPADQTENKGIALFLHGAPGHAKKVMGIFGAKAIAQKQGLIALAPEGNGTDYGWDSVNQARTNPNADTAFISELLTNVRAEHNISSDKLYVFGYSAGGFMGYTLACEIPESITAMVSLAGQFRGDFASCTTSTPVQIHHLHSHSDRDVPYSGRVEGLVRSVDDTIAFWTNKNGCSDQTSVSQQPGVTASSSGSSSLSYQGCMENVTLTTLTQVPHEAAYLPEQLQTIFSPVFSR
jgi:polyhydroxybutyrate depolymerase